MSVPAILCVASTLLAGCGTVIHRAEEPVFVDSRPAGAAATIYCGEEIRVTGTTPARLSIPRRAQGCILRVDSPGYNTARVDLHRGYSGGFWGNFAVSAVLGMAVLVNEPSDESLPAAWAASALGAGGFLIDRATGRAYSHDPVEIVVDLERTNP